MRLIDADELKERIRKALGIKSLDNLLPSEKTIVNQIDMASTIQPEPCEDAVSRKAVIDAIDEWKEACEDSGHKETVSDIKLIRKDFIELPSVTPKQRTGKWIKTARWGKVYYCNQCRNYLDFDGVNVGRGNTNFCPNCGADMREVSNGN